ncbi:hypothetical protein, partial [Nocardiopsis rhodophaea]|uniref:hypothetical protein n=1 Tax=Nocardiopsis rhodophaea TaxID=280238 RepID=UPI0031DC1904
AGEVEREVEEGAQRLRSGIRRPPHRDTPMISRNIYTVRLTDPRLPLPGRTAPRVLGVDDVALRKIILS